MNRIWTGIFIGLLISAGLAAVAVPRYGDWRQKIGHLQGEKVGTIAVVDFLAKHFPEPDGRPVEPGRHFGLKWYGIDVIQTNGITSLQVSTQM